MKKLIFWYPSDIAKTEKGAVVFAVVAVAWAIGENIWGTESVWLWMRGASAEIASWVQATGSIAAIYYSLRVARRQMKEQRENQEISENRVHLRHIDDEKARELLRVWNKNIILLGSYSQVCRTYENILLSIKRNEVNLLAFSVMCRIAADSLDKHTLDDYPTAFDAVDMTSIKVFLEQVYQILMGGKGSNIEDTEKITSNLSEMLTEHVSEIKSIKFDISEKIRENAPHAMIGSIERIIKKIDPPLRT